jgi:hypothetical protein
MDDMAEPRGAALCLVCAWRENCQKKYSVQASPSMRCPDFERDLTIKSEEGEPPAKDKESKRPH